MIRKIKIIGSIFICLVITSNDILGAGATATSKLLKKLPEIVAIALTGKSIDTLFSYFLGGLLLDEEGLKRRLDNLESEMRLKDDEIANQVRLLRLQINSQTTRDEYYRMANNTINSINARIAKLENEVADLERKALEQDRVNKNFEERINKHDEQILDLQAGNGTKDRQGVVRWNRNSTRQMLRKTPLIISDMDDVRIIFRLSGKLKPIEYIENDFKDNGDGTITDYATGLMWQKSGSLDYMSYEKAKAYVGMLNRDKFAGYMDWRLPTVDELKSLLTQEKQSKDLCIDPVLTGETVHYELYIDPIFDMTQEWCSTSDQKASDGAWNIYFYDGRVGWNYFHDNNYVRAVRSIQ